MKTNTVQNKIFNWRHTTFIIIYLLLIAGLFVSGGRGHDVLVEATTELGSAIIGTDSTATEIPAVPLGTTTSVPSNAENQLASQSPSDSIAPAAKSTVPNPTSESGALRVVGVYPLPGSGLSSREIVVYFDAALAPVNDQHVANDISRWMTIQPALTGQIHHESNKLVYRIDEGINIESVPYQIKLHPDLQSTDGRKLHPDGTKFTVLGYRFSADKHSIRKELNGEYQILINFTRRISPENISQYFMVEDAEGQILIDIKSQVNGPWLTLVIPPETPMPVTVILKRGLKELQGEEVLHWPVSLVVAAPPVMVVEEAVWKQESSRDNRILLQFSKPVSNLGIHSFIQVYPHNSDTPIECNVTVSGNTALIYLYSLPQSTNELRVVVGNGLRDNEGGYLEDAYEVILEPKIQPLTVQSRRWERSARDGSLVLNLDLNHDVDAESLKENLQIVPEVTNIDVQTGSYQEAYITADWQGDTVYRLNVGTGVKNNAGNLLLENALRIVLDRTPVVKTAYFDYPGKLYFPQRMAGPLLLHGRNIEKATVRLHQLLPNNIVLALDMMQQDRTSNYFNNQFSRFIAENVIEFPDTGEEIKEAPLLLDNFMPADMKGVFALGIRPNSDYNNNKLMLWTEIGLLAHWRDEELVVFAHDLLTLEPLSLAKVTVYSNKNQVLGTANTDGRGIAHLRAMDNSFGQPRVVVVETDNDYTFLDLQARFDENPDFSTNMPSYDPEAYDTFIYSDRNLYRPGETIHARWFVRTNYGDALAGVPLLVRFRNPQGVVVLEEATELSQWGSGGLEIVTQKAYTTGRYQIELLVPGAKNYLQAESVSLEDFVPNRVSAEIDTADSVWLADAEYDFTVVAKHLFGPPAGGLKTEAGFILRQGEFKSKQWPGFHFGNHAEFTPVTTSLGDAVTDELGKATYSFRYAGSPPLSFPAEVVLRGTVSEVGGRGVTTSASRLLLPEPELLGINLKASTQQNGIDVAVVAINAADETPAVMDTVTVTLEQVQWQYNLRRLQGYQEPSWMQHFVRVEEQEVPLTNGEGQVSFTLRQRYGKFRVRVHTDGKEQFASQSFNLYWNRVEVEDKGVRELVKVQLNQPVYKHGEIVRLEIESGFDGKAMVLVQGESFLETLLTDVKDGHGTVEFMVGPDHYPNVWASVTMAHAVEPGTASVYPYSSFQAINIPLEDPKRELQVSFIDLPEDTTLPSQPLEISIQVSDSQNNPVRGEVTLAAVDEGIHAILDYTNPNPYRWFQRSRKPDMRWNHYYDKVAYDFTPAPIGGDIIARRLARDTAPVDENWIHPVALWSGVLKTDENGQANVSLNVPEFNGQLRFVAVAVSEVATGATAEHLTVRRPCVLQVTLPRFVLPGDQFVSQATLYNTTDQSSQITLSWQSGGVLQGIEGSREYTVGAGQRQYIQIPMEVGGTIGQGEIRWSLEVKNDAGDVNDSFVENMLLPVRAPATYQTDHEMRVLEPGETYTLTNRRFLEDSRLEATVTLGANPVLRLEEGLKYLVGYPYGCLEQTISRVMPSYLMRQSADMMSMSMDEVKDLDSFVTAGIERMLSMQTSSGGLAYWPGSLSAYPYGSVYALHFLTLLYNDGHASLPEPAFRSLQDYVRNVVLPTPQQQQYMSSVYLQAYAIYVLALDGDSTALEAIDGFERIDMSQSARYLLAAAKAVNMVDPTEARTYFNAQPSSATTLRETDGTLISPIRDVAVSLIALQHMQAPILERQVSAERLLSYMEQQRYPNTQDMAFIVTALAPYLQELYKDPSLAGAEINTPDGTYTMEESTLFSHQHTGPGIRYEIKNTGSIPLFMNAALTGVPEQVNLKPVEEGIALHRVLRDGQGMPMELVQQESIFEHGQTYIVTLNLKLSENMNHVVVADLLPAGLEIENPRLDTDVLTGAALAEAPTPDYLEIRDDRLVLAFDRLPQGEHQFHYAVRAVTPGNFIWPALNAECMYQPELHGRSAAHSAKVKTPESELQR